MERRKHFWWMAIGLISLATSCAGTPAPPGQASAAVSRCIATNQIAGRRVVAPTSVQFDMIGPVDYINDVGAACPATARLGSAAIISIISGGEGGKLCRGDRVRIFDPVETKATGLAAEPQCVLGNFTPIPRLR